jgi:hypothetical protein
MASLFLLKLNESVEVVMVAKQLHTSRANVQRCILVPCPARGRTVVTCTFCFSTKVTNKCFMKLERISGTTV